MKKTILAILLILLSATVAYPQSTTRVDQLTERTTGTNADIFMVGYDSGGGTYLYRKMQFANVPPTTTTVGSGVSARTVADNREYVFCTAACTVTPKTPAAGVELCVRNGAGSTGAIKLAAISSVYYEKTDKTGWQTSSNKYLQSGGAATDQICIVGYDSTHYAIMNSTGIWTSE